MGGTLLALAPQAFMRILLHHGQLAEAEILARHMASLCLIRHGCQLVTAIALNNLGIIKAAQGCTLAAKALLRYALGASLQPQQHLHAQTRRVVLMNLASLSFFQGNEHDAWSIKAHDLLYLPTQALQLRSHVRPLLCKP